MAGQSGLSHDLGASGLAGPRLLAGNAVREVQSRLDHIMPLAGGDQGNPHR